MAGDVIEKVGGCEVIWTPSGNGWISCLTEALSKEGVHAGFRRGRGDGSAGRSVPEEGYCAPGRVWRDAVERDASVGGWGCCGHVYNATMVRNDGDGVLGGKEEQVGSKDGRRAQDEGGEETAETRGGGEAGSWERHQGRRRGAKEEEEAVEEKSSDELELERIATEEAIREGRGEREGEGEREEWSDPELIRKMKKARARLKERMEARDMQHAVDSGGSAAAESELGDGGVRRLLITGSDVGHAKGGGGGGGGDGEGVGEKGGAGRGYCFSEVDGSDGFPVTASTVACADARAVVFVGRANDEDDEVDGRSDGRGKRRGMERRRCSRDNGCDSGDVCVWGVGDEEGGEMLLPVSLDRGGARDGVLFVGTPHQLFDQVRNNPMSISLSRPALLGNQRGYSGS